MSGEEHKTVEQVAREDGRYPPAAFEFLHESLKRAVGSVHGKQSMPPGQRHVSGRQLCHAARDLALERWGPLARMVLNRWNIRETLDIGNMVYLLIANQLMQKTEEDSLDDFRDVFQFSDAFRPKDRFELKE